MKYSPDLHHRRSVRLKGFDYSQEGAYFITLVVEQRICVFGEIRDGRMNLNVFGEMVRSEWLKTPQLRPNVVLDEFIVMPNHFHAIIVVERRGVLQYAPTKPHKLQSPSQTIGAIVRGFKGATTKQINVQRSTEASIWQRNYYERIIRDEAELEAIRDYIAHNPLGWDKDEENPNL